MALPVTIPNEFANATASIPLSQLDTNFNTLANAVNGISDGSETLANASVTVLTAGTVDINGGAIDGTTVGTSNAAAGSFTTLNTSGAVVFNDAGADVDFRVEGDTDANLLFVDASADKVGVGVNGPVAKLDLAFGNFQNAGAFRIGADIGDNTSRTTDTRKFGAITAPHFDNTEQNLVIACMDSQSNSVSILNIGTGSSSFNSPSAIIFGTSAAGITDGTERMRITSGGFFKASNTGTYSYPTLSINEFRSDSNSQTLAVQNANGSYTDYLLNLNVASAPSASFYFITAFATTGLRFGVDGNGDVTNFNNSYGSISDVKLKQDIVDAGSQWDDIKGLRVRKYRFKSNPDEPLQIGLVAQEVEEVSPGLIDEHPDYEETEVPALDDEGNQVLNEDGTPQVTKERNALGTTTKAVKYSVLYMKAVKALQEAMDRIETLEAKVAALENA